MTIAEYNKTVSDHNDICIKLQNIIDTYLKSDESKTWHGHPVWFINGNPIVGYSLQKNGVRLMFWSGRSFNEPELAGTSRFKDASIFYNDISEINETKIKAWLKKSETIQWDYKNVVKRKGELVQLYGSAPEKPKPTDVNEYLNQFSGETKNRLDLMRKIITDTAPESIESLSYGLVGYKYNGKPLVYFGGFANHIGFYATPNSHEEFTKEFSKYKQGKGSVQFPHDQPLPVDLIKKVVQSRVQAIIGG